MTRLASRLEALERKQGKRDGLPSRVVSIAGTDTSDEAIAAFLEPYGIDPDSDDTMLIIVRPLMAPDGPESRPREEAIPLSFVGPVPGWIKALPAYKDHEK